ncbi:MAG: CYTH domain-containing protein [Marinifilaceae bacterium]|jgi:adenylate cyclase
MAKEIERKFLVHREKLDLKGTGKALKQAYLTNEISKSIRIRIADQSAFLTIKSGSKGLVRSEYEYEIPLDDANEMLELCEPNFIDKHRHLVNYGKHTWEIDVFHGENEGLIVAEIELESEEEYFEKPVWLGEEVTDDTRYLNAALVKHPYSKW